MKLIQNIFVILSICANVVLFAADTVKVASSPTDTSYYELAKSMKTVFSGNRSKLTILPIETRGSVDNIKRLINHEVDLAIVQNDIAFFARNGLSSFESEEESLRIVIPLFKEPIFLLTRIQNVNDLTEMKNKKIVIGEVNSGLAESAKVILNSVNIWNSARKYNFPEKEALEKLKEKNVDIIFVNNLTNEMKELISKDELFIVPIPSNLVQKLQKTFPYFCTHKFIINKSESVSTIAVRSILITTADMDVDKIYEITDILVKDYDSLLFPDKYHEPKRELFQIDTPIDWHNGVELYFQKNNITPTSGLVLDRYFWYIIVAAILILLLLMFIIAIVMYRLGWLLTLSSRYLIFLREVYLYAIKYKYVLIIVFMIVSYAVSILVIKYFEHAWAIEHNVASTFDENPFFESLLWLFIFGSTGYNGDFFPSSSEGKLIVSLIPMIGLGGFFALIGFVTSDQIKKYILEAKGMSTVNFKDHIIVCGWNDRTPLLIEDLTHKNLSSKRPIVILSDNIDFNPIDKFHFNREYVKYVSGTGTDRESLRKANLAEAEIVIVVSDMVSSDPDARTILNVLTIEKFSTELIRDGERVGRKQIYTIAELIDKKNEQTAKDAQVNQVISLGDVESKVFAQSVQNPGVVKFVDEIFTYNDFNDIYSITIDKDCKLLGKTYDEILIILREQNILLLSINIEGRRNEQEVQDIKTKFNLLRPVITNPIEKSEQAYKVQEQDTLIVLARYEKDIIKARKHIK